MKQIPMLVLLRILNDISNEVTLTKMAETMIPICPETQTALLQAAENISDDNGFRKWAQQELEGVNLDVDYHLLDQ